MYAPSPVTLLFNPPTSTPYSPDRVLASPPPRNAYSLETVLLSPATIAESAFETVLFSPATTASLDPIPVTTLYWPPPMKPSPSPPVMDIEIRLSKPPAMIDQPSHASLLEPPVTAEYSP